MPFLLAQKSLSALLFIPAMRDQTLNGRTQNLWQRWRKVKQLDVTLDLVSLHFQILLCWAGAILY